MRSVLLLICSFLGISSLQAQSGFHIMAGTVVGIQPNTIFAVDGLALEPTAAVSISGANNLVRNSSISHPSPNSSIGRSFLWASTVSGFSGDITLYYSDAELNGISEPDLTLNVHNGTSWNHYPVAVVRDGTNNFVRTSGLSNLSLNELTLASINASLPLQWGTVKAFRESELAWITWETYQESDVAQFHVEKSLDGRNWSRVGMPLQARNTTGMNRYKQPDSTVTASRTIYRVKQTDMNGSFTYSNSVMIGPLKDDSRLVLYPNPAYQNLTVQLPAGNAAVRSYELFNAAGKRVREEYTPATGSLIIPIRDLPAGFYVIRVQLMDKTAIQASFLKD